MPRDPGLQRAPETCIDCHATTTSQGRTRQEVRRLPFAERLAAVELRSRQEAHFPLLGAHAKLQVRGLPPRAAGYGQALAAMRRPAITRTIGTWASTAPVRPLPHDLFVERRTDPVGREARKTSAAVWDAWRPWRVLALASLLARAAAPRAPITVPFDHLTTGFELDGVHRDLPCESCHLNAVFNGTPRDCGTCHITGSPFNATPKTRPTCRAPTIARPATTRSPSAPTCISIRPRSWAAASAATTARSPRARDRPIRRPARIAPPVIP